MREGILGGIIGAMLLGLGAIWFILEIAILILFALIPYILGALIVIGALIVFGIL